ncbi:TPA: deoxyribose-phosphate aldolase [Streptococcus suis]
MKLNKYIDHTVLKPETTQEQVEKVLAEAKEYDFASVCINPTWVAFAAEGLKDSDVKVCTVIGFPLGANTPVVKAFETKDAIANGADEIDMVINIGALKDKRYDLVLEDIKAVVEASGDKLVKVIIETCLLTDEEKVKACELSKEAGADFVKTSTGFSTGGATVADVALMRKTVGQDLGVKASGGARSYEDAIAFIEAGASRIGASSGVAIMKGEKADGDY